MLLEGLVPAPSRMRASLYQGLLPFQREMLYGGASGAGAPPESYMASMMRYWPTAPRQGIGYWY